MSGEGRREPRRKEREGARSSRSLKTTERSTAVSPATQRRGESPRKVSLGVSHHFPEAPRTDSTLTPAGLHMLREL